MTIPESLEKSKNLPTQCHQEIIGWSRLAAGPTRPPQLAAVLTAPYHIAHSRFHSLPSLSWPLSASQFATARESFLYTVC